MSKAKIYDPEFAKRINLILENKFNGNSSEFARSIGVAVTSLNRWLIGEADPSRTNLIKTAEVSGVSIEWLATGKDSQLEKQKDTIEQSDNSELSIKEALKALQLAIDREINNNKLSVKGRSLTSTEEALISNYRNCNDTGQEAIIALSVTMAKLASSSANEKECVEDNVA
ncbi:helix-turn-helix domain-containing protein [Gallibacterium anatis]|uniref:helix-turn-helix domain-containing protein n=1 Tax=Gallibacterium anatis TaxID=750 RepID=UPI003AAEE62C